MEADGLRAADDHGRNQRGIKSHEDLCGAVRAPVQKVFIYEISNAFICSLILGITLAADGFGSSFNSTYLPFTISLSSSATGPDLSSLLFSLKFRCLGLKRFEEIA